MIKVDWDMIVIGAGPAGLTAAQYGARSNLRVLVVERFAPGGQVLNIDKLENYPGVVPGKSGWEFAEDLRAQAENFGAVFLSGSVTALAKEGDVFRVGLENGGTLATLAVIAASGTKHRALDIPGEGEFYGRGVSYCAVCDGPFFKGKKIFVVGGGDAACDEAQYLSRFSSHIVLVHRRDRFRAQKALAERALKNPNIEVRFNTRLVEMKGGARLESVILEESAGDGAALRRYEEDASAVFVFAGSVPQASFLDALALERDEGGYVVTGPDMAATLPGLFAAGDLRATAFRQVVTAAGDGAVAAHSAASYIDERMGEVCR
jgi:thioredoxin reductase (NADPH)